MSEERTTARDYLACETHGDRTAEQVCGECGEPLCDSCAVSTRDAAFVSYTPNGMSTFFTIVGLLVVVPLVFYVLLPGILGQLRQALFPGTLIPLKTGIVHSSIILGLAMVPVLYYQGSENQSVGELLVRHGNDRYFCEDCADEIRTQRLLTYLFTGVAGLLVILGIYLVVQGAGGTRIPFGNIRVTALGGAVYVLRDQLVVEAVSRFD